MINSKNNWQQPIFDAFLSYNCITKAIELVEVLSEEEEFSNFDECAQAILKAACLKITNGAVLYPIASAELQNNLFEDMRNSRYEVTINEGTLYDN